MFITELVASLNESANMVEGTTCANCKFTKGQSTMKVARTELNKFGGIDPSTPTDLKNAIAADVITMPGAKFPTTKHICSNPLVSQWVTERMCCNLWDHPGLKRQFDGTEPKL